MNHRGVIIATHGAVNEDGRTGDAFVTLSDQLPARSFVGLGPPSAMQAELSALDQVVRTHSHTPADEELTVPTDSLCSIQKLQSLQRRDFPEWLLSRPEKVLLESLVARLNERSRRKVSTRLIKLPAHQARNQGHPLNELADAAASRVAVEGDEEAAAVSHADSRAVLFVNKDRLTEWGAGTL